METDAGLKKLLDEITGVAEGAGEGFVGMDFMVPAAIMLPDAVRKLRVMSTEDPDKMWHLLLAGWVGLMHNVTERLADKDSNVGFENHLWAAFGMLALYFRNKGNWDRIVSDAELLKERAAAKGMDGPLGEMLRIIIELENKEKGNG